MINYLIAFGDKPAPTFVGKLREICAHEGIDLKGLIVTTGPGCYNLAIRIPENENFVNQLTMALMPARWSTTQDAVPEGEFTDEVNR